MEKNIRKTHPNREWAQQAQIHSLGDARPVTETGGGGG